MITRRDVEHWTNPLQVWSWLRRSWIMRAYSCLWRFIFVKHLEIKLFAPEIYGCQPCSYFEATPEMLTDATGGCGPGGFGDILVPDRMYGLSVRAACSIHDWTYHWGETLEDKKLADRIFLNNMIRIIKAGSLLDWLKRLRLKRAKLYYNMVKNYGGPAFWDNKNKPYEMREVLT